MKGLSWRKLVALAMVFLSLLGSVSALAEADIEKPVVMRIYVIGNEATECAKRGLANLNALLTEKINATVEPLLMATSDFRKKVPLILASGEDYDMIFTASWIGYFTEGVKGPFLDLTDLLPQYAPKTYAEMIASGADKAVTINGRIYMVPANSRDYTAHLVYYREDLRKKYNCPEIVDYDTLEIYLDAIKANEPAMLPYNRSGMEVMHDYVFQQQNNWSRGFDTDDGVIAYDMDNPTEFFNVAETPEYAEFIQRAYNWNQKGYWSRSVLSEKTVSADQFLIGKSAMAIQNEGSINQAYQRALSENLGWEIGFVSLDTNGLERIAPANNGMAIGVNCPNPERALMFLELAHQDRDVYNAILYGVEGEMYELTADGKRTIPAGVDPASLSLFNIGMCVYDKKFTLEDAQYYPELGQWLNEQMDNSFYPPLAGFFLNQDNISAELAALKNVYSEFKFQLECGIMDPVEGLELYKAKLKEAGVDVVLAEANRQLQEYLSTR